MAVPKRRTSRMKQKTRAAANRWHRPLLKKCKCGASVPSHIACPSCGNYGERQVLEVSAD